MAVVAIAMPPVSENRYDRLPNEALFAVALCREPSGLGGGDRRGVNLASLRRKNMEIDQNRIEKAIVEDAVSRLISDYDLYSRVQRGIDERLNKLFADEVSVLIQQTVADITKQGFDHEYRKYDGFGKPVGEPTSISKELERLISNYWTVRVDRSGKPTDNSYGSTSRAEWMMLQICADDFSKEMKQHVVNVSGALKDHFRAVLNQHVAVLLSDVFKVQSAGDRALKSPGSSIIAPPAGPIGA